MTIIREVTNTSASAHSSQLFFKIQGIINHKCLETIDKSLLNLIGILKSDLKLNSKGGMITFDTQLISKAMILANIKECGFEVEAFPSETININIIGMTCQSCVKSISTSLLKLPGILNISISLKDNAAEIQFTKEYIGEDSIIQCIQDCGFDASIKFDSNYIPKLEPHNSKPKKNSIDISTELADDLTGFYSDDQTLSPTSARLITNIHNLPEIIVSLFEISGMTCASCVNSIEKHIATLPGIISVKVSLLAQRGEISHDTSIIHSQAIGEAIYDMGFDAKEIVLDDTDSVELSIFGMTCASCSGTIERELSKYPGILHVSINLLGQNGVFKYEKSKVGVRDIVNEIESLGFDALLPVKGQNTQIESLLRTKETLSWKHAFFHSLILAIPVTFISMIVPVFTMTLEDTKIIPGISIGDATQLLLTIPVQFIIGARFYRSSYRSLKHGTATMDVLVTLGTSLAFLFSIGSLIYSACHPTHPPTTIFFETCTTLICFIALGRYLENFAKGKTSSALSELMTLTPANATLLHVGKDWTVLNEKLIPSEYIQVGDILKVVPGEKIPTDGIIVYGTSDIDESLITGESIPVQKAPGDNAVGGTVNGSGRLFVKATKVGADTTLSQIVKLVSEAQMSKAPIQAVADKVAGYFVPAIIALGVLTLVVWITLLYLCGIELSPRFFPNDTGNLFIALNFCISVIVVACPWYDFYLIFQNNKSALGLATPTAIMVGTGVSAKHGILLKGGSSIESGSKLSKVVFDKTGTLTSGKMTVVNMQAIGYHIDEFLAIVSAAEDASEHHIARAITRYGKEKLGEELISEYFVSEFLYEVGKGISCTVNTSAKHKIHHQVLIGNALLLLENSIGVAPSWNSMKNNHESQGHTVIFVAIDGQFSGLLAVSDKLKPETTACIKALRSMGIEIAMMTGDQEQTANVIASECGITEVYAGISPHGKKAIVERMQSEGLIVAMVGDGINDSAALVQANLGIAVFGGTDVAIEAANIVLMKNDLRDVVTAIHLTRTIFKRIRLNFLWATIYNILMIPLATGIFIPAGFILKPMYSGMAMSLSSVSVVISSLLLKFYKAPKIQSFDHDNTYLTIDDELLLYDRDSPDKLFALKSQGSFSKLKVQARDMIKDILSQAQEKEDDIELAVIRKGDAQKRKQRPFVSASPLLTPAFRYALRDQKDGYFKLEDDEEEEND